MNATWSWLPGRLGCGSRVNFTPSAFSFFTQFVEVRNVESDMAIPGSHVFDVARAAGFDQFESRILILSAVTDIADAFLFFGVRPYALDVHAEQAAVKVDAPVEVAYQHHCVPNPKSDVV